MPPLPPAKRELAERSRESKRAPTPTFEKRTRPSKRDSDIEARSRPSKRADELEQRSRPSKRATSPELEQRSRPSKRASSPAIEQRSRPSKRAVSPAIEQRSRPSKRAVSPAIEQRSRPSKRAVSPAIEQRSRPSKRATSPAVVEKRSRPSKRATTPAIVQRSRPSKRATTPAAAKRSRPSKRATDVFQMQQIYAGRLEVRWATNNSIAGYVANDPTGESFGLNPTLPGENDLYVEYFDSNLLALNPEFPPPYFVGASGELPSTHDCSKKLQFANVQPGPSSAIWTLNTRSGALNATWINEDGNADKPSLAYNPAQNALSFTGDFNTRGSATEYPVYIYLSD